MITQKDLFARVRALGLTCHKTEGGDYRVARSLFGYYAAKYPLKSHGFWRERQEAEAYYCDDRDDAYATAIKMANSGNPRTFAKAEAAFEKVLF